MLDILTAVILFFIGLIVIALLGYMTFLTYELIKFDWDFGIGEDPEDE